MFEAAADEKLAWCLHSAYTQCQLWW